MSMSYHDYPPHYLSDREKWQDLAAETGMAGEINFAAALRRALPSHYEVIEEPPKLKVYSGGRGIVLDLKIYGIIAMELLFTLMETNMQVSL